jgi:hypothetical protein
VAPRRHPSLQDLRTLSWKQSRIHRAISRRLGVVRSFFNHFLQHVPIQRQIGHQALQPGVLVPQLPELTNLQEPHVRVALLPDVVRRLADPHLSADIRNRLTGVPLLEGKQNLLLGVPGLLHRFLSLPYKDSGSTLLQF